MCYFGNPESHVNGVASALHNSAVWGQPVNEMAKSTGVKHFDPHPTLGIGKSMIHFQSPTPEHTQTHTHLHFNSLENTYIGLLNKLSTHGMFLIESLCK